ATLDGASLAPLQRALTDPTTSVNPLALCRELVALLSAIAEDQPVVIIIDDGQWLDTSSADVIVAAFNDLFLDRVGLLVTVRRGDDRSFDGLEHLAIGGLSEAACSVVFA